MDKPLFLEELLKYAGTDLLLFRTASPLELQERQAALWDPVLKWAETDLLLTFKTTCSLIPPEQPAETLQALRTLLEGFTSPEREKLFFLTRAYGSLLLALAVGKGHLSPRRAFELSILEELWQNERWGTDPVQEDRRRLILAEIEKVLAGSHDIN